MLKGIGEEATYFYHPDHLGSVSVVSNHQGVPYERVEYLPFGEVWIEEVDPATGYIPFRFTSKELDRETGLYYYGARYYEPRASRWMSADPAGFGLVSPMDEDGEPVPNGWPEGFGPGPSVGMRPGYSVIEATNWYSYVSNNPVKYVDPSGAFEIWHSGVTDNQNSYRIKRNTGGVFNLASFYLPFYNEREKAENWISNFTKHGVLVHDSTVSKFDVASFVLDTASFFPGVRAAKDLSRVLTAFGLTMGAKNAKEHRELEKRMFSFLDGYRTGILRNVFSDEEAIARVNLFAAGADAFYRYDLEGKGISHESWSKSLLNILNGKMDDQFFDVMENLGHE